ncbi:TraB/GumN family protein [Thermomonas sp.]|uniref:TraB/GumN family protein n=1 Tax=Thermomonas sp. TaxID=1971895 RepID=UPI00261631E5|nr:TraB/GumN family protein [Thermomonas sp.]
MERDGVHYTLLGTAHVSWASVDAVRAAIDSNRFDAIAVELDAQRLKALTQPDAMAELDLVKVIRERKVAPFAANLALAAYQRRLAEQMGIEPGAELKAAAVEAEARGLPLQLIDRDVGITFRRILQGLGWWDRMKLIGGVGASLFSSDEVAEEDIERLKEGDMLESSFSEFAKQTPTLFATLIDERDQYMAARLRERSDGAKHVLAVVGAGHLKGMAGYLETGTEAPAAATERLCEIRQRRKIPWFTIVLLALIFGGIAWGYYHGGASLGRDLLLQWVAWTCGLTALGALLAGARPLAILVATLVAPFKPFRPTFPSGMFSALIDLRSRKPAYPDFLALRDDAQTLHGWYRNRVTRVLLVFLLTNLGTVAGEYVAGVSIFGKLVGG